MPILATWLYQDRWHVCWDKLPPPFNTASWLAAAQAQLWLCQLISAWQIISLAPELNFKGKVHCWQRRGWEHLEERIVLGFHLARPQCLFPQRSGVLLVRCPSRWSGEASPRVAWLQALPPTVDFGTGGFRWHTWISKYKPPSLPRNSHFLNLCLCVLLLGSVCSFLLHGQWLGFSLRRW